MTRMIWKPQVLFLISLLLAEGVLADRITLKNGESVVGYVFDRRVGKSLADSYVRVLLQESHERREIAYAEIAALAFTGRDTAAGKSWEAWVQKYTEKKAAGESNIGLQPDEDA